MRVVECITRREYSRWLLGTVEGWMVGGEYFVGAICFGVDAQLDLDDDYDGSPERIHAMQYATPNRKFPKDECINPWQVVRIRDDRNINRVATLRVALALARREWIWTHTKSINLT